MCQEDGVAHLRRRWDEMETWTKVFCLVAVLNYLTLATLALLPIFIDVPHTRPAIHNFTFCWNFSLDDFFTRASIRSVRPPPLLSTPSKVHWIFRFSDYCYYFLCISNLLSVVGGGRAEIGSNANSGGRDRRVFSCPS